MTLGQNYDIHLGHKQSLCEVIDSNAPLSKDKTLSGFYGRGTCSAGVCRLKLFTALQIIALDALRLGNAREYAACLGLVSLNSQTFCYLFMCTGLFYLML